MTPWELEHTLDALLARARRGHDPAVAAALDARRRSARVTTWRAGVGPLRRRRRRAGRRSTRCAHAARRRRSAVAAGDARLPNGMLGRSRRSVQLVLRAALDPDRRRVDRGAASRRRHGDSPSRRIDRPVFIVSSPRSGSTLLFETLARARGLFTIGGESHQRHRGDPGAAPGVRTTGSRTGSSAADATPDVVDAAARAGSSRSSATATGTPPTGGAVRMLEKTPKNALRVPFLAAAFPDARFVYLYRDPRETISSMLDAWRSGRFVTYPDAARLGRARRGRCSSCPGWRELVGRAARRGRGARSGRRRPTVLLDDLEALDPDRWCVASYDRLVSRSAGRDRAHLRVLRPRVGRRPLGAALPLSRHTLDSPHPDKWRRNADELEPYWDRVREVAVRAHGVFAAPPRDRAGAHAADARRRRGTGRSARAGTDGRAGREPFAQRAHHRVPRAAAPTTGVVAARVHLPERARHRRARRRQRGAQHALPRASRARWAWRARRGELAIGTQGAGRSVPEPARAERRASTRPAARRVLRAARRRTPPATSASTTSRSSATSCGS